MLREELIKRYGSLKKAARALKVSAPFLSMVLKGKRKPPPELVILLENKDFDVTELEYYFKDLDMPKEVNPNDYAFLLHQYKKLIVRQDILLRAEQMTIVNLKNDITRLREKLKLTKK